MNERKKEENNEFVRVYSLGTNAINVARILYYGRHLGVQRSMQILNTCQLQQIFFQHYYTVNILLYIYISRAVIEKKISYVLYCTVHDEASLTLLQRRTSVRKYIMYSATVKMLLARTRKRVSTA
jgi:hypothetical protein